MVSADNLATAEVREKRKVIQRTCEDESETVPTSVLEVIDLSREVVETKRNNV